MRQPLQPPKKFEIYHPDAILPSGSGAESGGATLGYRGKKLFGTAEVYHQGTAFWADVLDDSFNDGRCGPTTCSTRT